MYEAAMNGDEAYFDHWLSAMKKNGLSMMTIKSKIEKLDYEQYSVLHYTVRYDHWNLSRKFIEDFHCDVNLIGRDGETPLHTAARYGISSSSIINCLVTHHANLSKPDNHGRTALHHATMRNNFHNAKQLIQLGASIDIFDENNATPLHFACRFHAVDCVRLLLEYHASIDRPDANGNTPLHSLALSPPMIWNENQEQEKIAYCLFQTAKDDLRVYLNMENKDRKTALSLACEYGNRTLVNLLLHFGANLDHYMPIHMAVKSGNVDIVRLLIEYQVQLTLVNLHHETPLHVACQYHRTDVLRVLMNHQMDVEIRDDRGYTPLLTASSFNDQDCMRILLLNRADLTAIDKSGKNILHICIERNCPNAFRSSLQWLKEGINRSNMFIQGDCQGNTVLHAAARNQCREIGELLIDTIEHLLLRTFFIKEYLSFILQKNRNQRTAIHEAAKMGNFILLTFFFRMVQNDKQKILCEDSDDELKTSLHLAAAEGHLEIVQFLLDRGANVSACDMNDSTPLHEAAAHNRSDCVELLLRHQAPINQYDGKHYTPLHRASQAGHWKIVRLLLNSHADVRRVNCDGYNSLEVAILNHHQSAVQEFLRHPTWTKSLRNAQVHRISERNRTGKEGDLSTPVRKLIRSMPNEAEEVFTRCLKEIGGSEDYSYKILFNYEFLEDQLAMWKWKVDSHIQSIDLPRPKPSKWNLLSCFKNRIDTNTNSHVYTLRQNHPLYMIITYHQHDLLKHPLIDRLIKRKWVQFSRTFFWILFLFYGFFLASFTSTILRVHHPQYYYSLFNASISTVSCETISLNLLRHESFILTKKNSYDTMIKWFLFSTILVHIIKNVLLICIRLRMFFGLSNLLELIALILCIIFSHDFYSWQMSIRFRCSFQWQCGALGILIGWITLIIYVQFLSTSGIYVVMLEVILRKFLRFIPILIIFILGFGLSFHMLLQNQNVYRHTFDALIRTVLMLTGEFNYEEHLYRSENENNRYYYQIIYLLYILFCILITILIMNLLVAHAVGEIPPLIERANVKYSIVCIKLIMDYEIFLSTFDCLIPYLKQRVKMLIENNQNEIIYPNRYKHRYHHLKKFFADRRKNFLLKTKEEKLEQLIRNL